MEKITYSYKLYGGEPLKQTLSKEEQKKYSELAEQGNYEAKQTIFEHNLRLVSNVINKYYYGFEYNQEELFQVGSMALWEAIPKFKLEYNTEFSTYVVPIILGTIKKFLRKNTIINFPNTAKDLLYKIQKLKEEYLKQNIELTTKQISQLLNIKENHITYILNTNKSVISLNQSVYKSEEGSVNIEERLITSNNSVEEQIIKKERNEIISQVIDSLGEKESVIIRNSFGFNCERKTQDELAKMLKISQSSVSMVYRTSLKKLKNILPNYLEGNLQCPKTLINYNKRN